MGFGAVFRAMNRRAAAVLAASFFLFFLLKDGKAAESLAGGAARRQLLATEEQEREGGGPVGLRRQTRRCRGARAEGVANITHIAVIGERHSGTNYVEALLAGNLDRGAHQVQPWLVAWKHWLQLPGYERYCVKCPRAPPAGGHDFSRTLLVVVVRNPHDWAFAMHDDCWHCERLNDLPFEDFIRAPWVNPDAPGAAGSEDAAKAVASPPKPPLRSRLQQIYEPNEWDRSHAPFANIMALRTAKLLHFLNVSRWPGLGGSVVVRHEDVLLPAAAKAWVRSLVDSYGLTLAEERARAETSYKGKDGSKFDPAAAKRASPYFNTAGVLASRRDMRPRLALINRLIDPIVESLFGYGPLDLSSSGRSGAPAAANGPSGQQQRAARSTPG